jgi:hypothetical protein
LSGPLGHAVRRAPHRVLRRIFASLRWGASNPEATKKECCRMAEFIYTMKKVRKAHGDKVILDDVT